jgi:2,4-dienoyl-CoA reductase-like NADH-dependent reductase (Old Yellow Enzyme family)
VHAEGALLGVELNHSGRVGHSRVSGFQPVAPSPVPFGGETPRELPAAEVAGLVCAFGQAAQRCVAAGVDVIELHAAHGYLIHEFLSPRTNRRADRYADPVLFLNEILVGVRKAVPGTPVFVRLSAFEGVPGGLDADAMLALAERIRLDLVDVIDISAGCYEAGEWIVQPGEFRRGVLAPFAARYRRRFGRPVCVAGRIPTGPAAEAILAAGDADLVAVGRALHADPQWPNKVLAGTGPRPCIACNQGCIDQVHTQRPIWCVVNPGTGHEWVPPPPAGARQRVVVVGGGVAGLEAARTAAERGHDVTLVEARPYLGGQFRIAAALPSRAEFGRLLDWYAAEVERLKVDLRLGTTADADLLAHLDPDAVVVASGGVGIAPAVPGIDAPRVADLRTWLDLRPPVPDGQTVTIWGADRVGVAAADVIAADGAAVLLIGAQADLAPEAGRREKIMVLPRLRANPLVRVELGTTLEAIEADRILVGHGGTRSWIDVSGPVLVSQGTVPAPVDLGSGRWRTYVVGEAGFGGSAADAIRDGAVAGRQIG